MSKFPTEDHSLAVAIEDSVDEMIKRVDGDVTCGTFCNAPGLPTERTFFAIGSHSMEAGRSDGKADGRIANQ